MPTSFAILTKVVVPKALVVHAIHGAGMTKTLACIWQVSRCERASAWKGLALLGGTRRRSCALAGTDRVSCRLTGSRTISTIVLGHGRQKLEGLHQCARWQAALPCQTRIARTGAADADGDRDASLPLMRRGDRRLRRLVHKTYARDAGGDRRIGASARWLACRSASAYTAAVQRCLWQGSTACKRHTW